MIDRIKIALLSRILTFYSINLSYGYELSWCRLSGNFHLDFSDWTLHRRRRVNFTLFVFFFLWEYIFAEYCGADVITIKTSGFIYLKLSQCCTTSLNLRKLNNIYVNEECENMGWFARWLLKYWRTVLTFRICCWSPDYA